MDLKMLIRVFSEQKNVALFNRALELPDVILDLVIAALEAAEDGRMWNEWLVNHMLAGVEPYTKEGKSLYHKMLLSRDTYAALRQEEVGNGGH